MTDATPFLVRMPPELRHRVVRCAAKEDRSMASVIRQAIREYVAEHDAPDSSPEVL